jgi:hypothetical protein
MSRIPEVATILIGGHRPLMAAASLRLKAGGLDHIDRVHADEKFVLDDQNDGSLFVRLDHTLHL